MAELVGCSVVRFGFPNDEVLHGHPLFAHGLKFYAVNEVLDSSWLAEVRAIERHHDRAPALPFRETRHWILTFHDTTMEALATGIELRSVHPDRASAMEAMIGLTVGGERRG